MSEAPLFGHVEDHTATQPFRVEYYDLVDREVRVEEFLSYADPGSGPILAYLRRPDGADDAEMMRLAGRLVIAATVDDDGPVRADSRLGGAPERNEHESDEEWESRVRAFEERRAMFDDRASWTSARRFAVLAADPRYKLAGTVLQDLADWISRQAMARPTRKPKP